MLTQQGRHGISALALIVALAWSAHIPADAQSPDAADSDGGIQHAALASGGGCVGGAVIGTVVPGIGNIVGCGVGLVAGLVYSLSGEDDPGDG